MKNLKPLGDLKIRTCLSEKFIVIHDRDNGLYTISLLEKGGPIYTDTSYRIALKGFFFTLKLSRLLRKLETHKKV